VLLQETKIRNSRHVDTFRVHLDNEVGCDNYQLFVNDHRQHLEASAARISGGVAIYFHSATPGFKGLHHLEALDVPDRYMVVKTKVGDVEFFFHNVYAPVVEQQRPAFFSALPRDFPAQAVHIVGGDFNFPFDVELDGSSRRSEHNVGKAECVE
jgi:hypothetical protein